MALVGAGLAEAGKVPFASTFAIFSERAFEQFRNGIARTDSLSTSVAATVACTLDRTAAVPIDGRPGIFRTLPEVTVMTVRRELLSVNTKKLLDHPKPSYTRTARNKTREIYTKEEAEPCSRKASVLREGADASIIACGVMVERALEAADGLAGRGSRPRSSTYPHLEPIDRGPSSGCKLRYDRDGRGPLRDWRTRSAVAEVLVEEAPTKMRMIGVRDKFRKWIHFRHHGQDGSDIREHRIESGLPSERAFGAAPPRRCAMSTNQG